MIDIAFTFLIVDDSESSPRQRVSKVRSGSEETINRDRNINFNGEIMRDIIGYYSDHT